MDPASQTITSLDRQLRELVTADPLAALAAVKSARAVVAEREKAAVMAALDDHTWREIGEALGVSKQAVFQRFGKDWLAATRARMSKPAWKQTVKRKLAR